MKAKQIKHSPTSLQRLFNESFEGKQVTPHTVRNWMLGKTLPTQDKLAKPYALKPSHQVSAQRRDCACGLHRVLANVIVYLRDDGALLRCVCPSKGQLF